MDRWATSWPSDSVSLHEIEVASHYKDCDWQIEDRPEGIGLLLPEVQGFRTSPWCWPFAHAMRSPKGNGTKRPETLQIGYAAGRHMGQGPTFIHVYVGGAIARMMDEQVEAWVQQPGSRTSTGRLPIYLALTSIPNWRSSKKAG